MSLTALTEALDDLDEPACCEGTYRLTERLAIALPDGDVAAADDATFVDWLVEHSEPAPFGRAGETKIDPAVRNARRLLARGQAQIAGFDPAAVLDAVEAALSPRWHLAAQLTDVILYPAGGKFGRHKDTPRSRELVGTLVVGLPIAHTGGAFHTSDGRREGVFDWSGAVEPSTLRWVALFGDVDHEIKPVTAGARVTLVYALVRTDRPRADATWEARRATLRRMLQPLASHAEWPVMIACTRHVITGDSGEPASIETLRGLDRDLADVIAEMGFGVAVRGCVAACPSDGAEPGRFPSLSEMWSITRLKRALTPKAIAALDSIVTFAEEASDDDGNDLSAYSLAPYILDDIRLDSWVIRGNAAATMIHEALFSDSGDFGNEAYDAHLYTLAALEVSRGP